MPIRLYRGGILLRHFPINSPTGGSEQRVYYNAKDDKKQLLEDYILEYWSPYCDDHWLWQGKVEENKYNYEDRVKQFLDRCANFLLMGEYDRSDIMSGNDIARIKSNELSLDGDWQNNGLEIDANETVNYLNSNIKNNFGGDSKILETEFDNKPATTRNKIESGTSRMIKLFSEDEKELDDYERVHVSNTFNVWKKGTKTIPSREGVIDKLKPHLLEWCVVDTENEFKFRKSIYKISKDVAQYNIRSKMPRFDDYRNDYQMDQILVCEQGGNLFFFDEDIFQINDENIQVL